MLTDKEAIALLTQINDSFKKMGTIFDKATNSLEKTVEKEHELKIAA